MGCIVLVRSLSGGHIDGPGRAKDLPELSAHDMVVSRVGGGGEEVESVGAAGCSRVEAI